MTVTPVAIPGDMISLQLESQAQRHFDSSLLSPFPLNNFPKKEAFFLSSEVVFLSSGDCCGLTVLDAPTTGLLLLLVVDPTSEGLVSPGLAVLFLAPPPVSDFPRDFQPSSDLGTLLRPSNSCLSLVPTADSIAFMAMFNSP